MRTFDKNWRSCENILCYVLMGLVALAAILAVVVVSSDLGKIDDKVVPPPDNTLK